MGWTGQSWFVAESVRNGGGGQAVERWCGGEAMERLWREWVSHLLQSFSVQLVG